VQAGRGFQRASDELVLEIARHLLAVHFRSDAPLFSDHGLVREFLRLEVGPRTHEVFAVILLDNKHRFIDYVELFYGTIDHVKVHTRRVLECALMHHASGVVLVHNHPAGNPEPSQSDVNMTTLLKKALSAIEVTLVDHFVVGETVVSMAERGLVG
jgi:DNA repair protein RadC